jgi:hypothetical protein
VLLDKSERLRYHIPATPGGQDCAVSCVFRCGFQPFVREKTTNLVVESMLVAVQAANVSRDGLRSLAGPGRSFHEEPPFVANRSHFPGSTRPVVPATARRGGRGILDVGPNIEAYCGRGLVEKAEGEEETFND